MVMRVLIIGGVAGGATAAARLRRLDESADLLEDSSEDESLDSSSGVLLTILLPV